MLEFYLINELSRLRALAAQHGLARLDEFLQDASLVACSEIHDRAAPKSAAWAAAPRMD